MNQDANRAVRCRPRLAPSLADFQDLIRAMYFEKDVARGIDGTFMWLMEEIGELAAALRGGTHEERLGEFADVLAWLATIANVAGVDLAEAVAQIWLGLSRLRTSSSASAPTRRSHERRRIARAARRSTVAGRGGCSQCRLATCSTALAAPAGGDLASQSKEIPAAAGGDIGIEGLSRVCRGVQGRLLDAVRSHSRRRRSADHGARRVDGARWRRRAESRARAGRRRANDRRGRDEVGLALCQSRATAGRRGGRVSRTEWQRRQPPIQHHRRSTNFRAFCHPTEV